MLMIPKKIMNSTLIQTIQKCRILNKFHHQYFFSFDEKGQPSSSGYPTLNITGRIHFGGIEIHYI